MKINTCLEARNKIIDDLNNFVIGPSWDDERSCSISFNPLNQYATAVLFPRDISRESEINFSDDEVLDDEKIELKISDSQISNNKLGNRDDIYDNHEEKKLDE